MIVTSGPDVKLWMKQGRSKDIDQPRARAANGTLTRSPIELKQEADKEIAHVLWI